MEIFTLILFVVYTYGLGFGLTFFVKNREDWYERHIIRLGVGLAFFIVLGTLLNVFGIIIDWRIFLVLALIGPLVHIIRSRKFNAPNFRLTKSNISLFFVIIMFFFSVFMYYNGAIKYPYLEDDDPWSYALGAKYVAQEKTLFAPEGQEEMFRYLDPYPPAYEMLMGVLHQTSSSLSWTLKFFNALIISLGLLFFYFFAKNFLQSSIKAAFATFVLLAVPAYFTHFIWSLTLVVCLFMVALYSLENISYDKRWMYVSAVAIAAVILTHITQSFKIAIMLFLFFLGKCIVNRKFETEIFLSGILGGILSLAWWSTRLIPMINFSKSIASLDKYGGDFSGGIFSKIASMFPYNSGTATRAYTFSDFFSTKPFGGINVQVGFGLFSMLIFLVGLIYIISKYKSLFKESSWELVTLMWLLFTFLAVNSMTFSLPIGLWAFRTWHFLAIPIALIAGQGLAVLIALAKSIKIPSFVVVIIIVLAIGSTSLVDKYKHNNMIWPAGVSWTSSEELQAYSYLLNLPPDTKVFSYSTDDSLITGFDKFSCQWCDDIMRFRQNILDKDVDELTSFLKRNNYDYLLLSGSSYKKLGEKYGFNESKPIIDGMLARLFESDNYIAVLNKGIVLFEIK